MGRRIGRCDFPQEGLTAEKILPGRCYEAKRPAVNVEGFYNDRYVTWVNSDRTKVQYDSPNVAAGRHNFPTIEMDKFLAWAKREITALMPKDECSWRRKPNGDRRQQ
jgi:hypothetical protein